MDSSAVHFDSHCWKLGKIDFSSNRTANSWMNVSFVALATDRSAVVMPKAFWHHTNWINKFVFVVMMVYDVFQRVIYQNIFSIGSISKAKQTWLKIKKQGAQMNAISFNVCFSSWISSRWHVCWHGAAYAIFGRLFFVSTSTSKTNNIEICLHWVDANPIQYTAIGQTAPMKSTFNEMTIDLSLAVIFKWNLQC